MHQQHDQQKRKPKQPVVVVKDNNNILDEEILPSAAKTAVSNIDYRRFIYKCHECLLGFKRRGMLVNHLAKRHPETPLESVPELNLPILKATRDYYCQYCNKVSR